LEVSGWRCSLLFVTASSHALVRLRDRTFPVNCHTQLPTLVATTVTSSADASADASPVPTLFATVGAAVPTIARNAAAASPTTYAAAAAAPISLPAAALAFSLAAALISAIEKGPDSNRDWARASPPAKGARSRATIHEASPTDAHPLGEGKPTDSPFGVLQPLC